MNLLYNLSSYLFIEGRALLVGDSSALLLIDSLALGLAFLKREEEDSVIENSIGRSSMSTHLSSLLAISPVRRESPLHRALF